MICSNVIAESDYLWLCVAFLLITQSEAKAMLQIHQALVIQLENGSEREWRERERVSEEQEGKVTRD